MSTTTSRAGAPTGDNSKPSEQPTAERPAADQAPADTAPVDTAPVDTKREPTWKVVVSEAAPHLPTLWPYAACLLALFLAWPSGWAGQATWFHLPLTIRAGGVLFLGAVASGLVVAALIREPWARVGVAAGIAALSWASTEPPVMAQNGRLVLAVLLVVGVLIGLGLGNRARRGVLGVSTVLALLAGISPSSWPHAPLLAVAVALPFWLATRDRVAPTLWAVVRALAVFVVARVVGVAFAAGWVSGTKPGLYPVRDMTRRVGASTWDTLRHKGFDIGQTALTTHTSWIWGGVVLAVWLVVARVTRRAPRQ